MDENLQNYKIIVEIFKGYLDTALTVHTSYYALTGAIAAYYLANRKERPYIKYALILPFFLGLTLAIVSFTGMAQALTLQGKVNDVVKGLAMSGAPPVDILRRGLLVMGSLDVVVCASLVLLFCWPSSMFDSKEGQVRLAGNIRLNENAKVYVLEPDIESNARTKKFDLAEMISRMPSEYQASEESFGVPVGKEEW